MPDQLRPASVCRSVWVEEGAVEWYCTLDDGHDGMHGAGNTKGEILVWWAGSDATETGADR